MFRRLIRQPIATCAIAAASAAPMVSNADSVKVAGMCHPMRSASSLCRGTFDNRNKFFNPSSLMHQTRNVMTYTDRHVGPTDAETQSMLATLGYKSLEDLVNDIVPADIRRPPMEDIPAMSEDEALAHLRGLMGRNKVLKSCIGQGYYESVVPPAVIRNILEAPGWYTPYTPYQAEISQGRLESLVNYQTVVTELTKVPISNASLLDEATAAFEAVHLAFHHHRMKRPKVFVSDKLFKSSIEMIRTRSSVLKIEVVVGDVEKFDGDDKSYAAVLVQNPDANGNVVDFTSLFTKAKASGIVCVCGTDLLASALMKPAGDQGADVVYGNAQRLGVPLGYGGPHPAFFAVRDEFKRLMPGRLIGVSKDSNGNPCLRMALQTREQHIKREKATSNVCTAQALLSNMVAFFSVYHGAEGLQSIAHNVHTNAKILSIGLASAGHEVLTKTFFDTITIKLKADASGKPARTYATACVERGINIYVVDDETVSIAVDEATDASHIAALLESAGLDNPNVEALRSVAEQQEVLTNLVRNDSFLQQEVFKRHRSETELMRYAMRLQRKDYSLADGMVPLGSCTMKLNAAAAMLPMSWPEVGNLHPHVPEDQVSGYRAMFVLLKSRLRAVTGLAACSLQPNSGSQGEYAGLRVIRSYHESKGEGHRHICLIPVSAHGTNPASSQLAGLTLVPIKCTSIGRIDVDDLTKKCKEHAKNLACIMMTYPSTYGVFDSDVKLCTQIVHDHGGQVYIDGANLNAMVGVTGPGFFGGDVCHINMHKTFSIPHGGGGPGMGPICVREHLTPFLPDSTFGPQDGGSKPFGQCSQAPYGSASILNISYMSIAMLGTEGLTKCTQYALLNANYLMQRLSEHYGILYKGTTGRCAHEFIVDLRPFKTSAGIEAEDVAKRLMDYGFHAPTLAFPVAGTLMVEPTESENKYELDRFAEAMIAIRQEIREIEEGKYPKDNNVLLNSPHTAEVVSAEEWSRPYTRAKAAYPLASIRANKFWPAIGRVDGAYGDRHLLCTWERHNISKGDAEPKQ